MIFYITYNYIEAIRNDMPRWKLNFFDTKNYNILQMHIDTNGMFNFCLEGFATVNNFSKLIYRVSNNN